MFSFDLRENERLIKIYRQSESLLIEPAALVLVLVYTPTWFLLKYGLIVKFAWFLAAWVLILLLYSVNKYFLWLLQTYIITSKRIITIKYTSIVKSQTEELAISDIGTIREIKSGVFGKIFSLGTIELDGRGLKALRLENLRNFLEIKNLVWELKEKSHANQAHSSV